VLRLKGELLAHNGNMKEAESWTLKAVQTAQDQKAKTLELRAAMSLARLWAREGRAEEAHNVLKRIYSWFTEGFDTLDLKEARELLVNLAQKI
jgi:predicted ATPase